VIKHFQFIRKTSAEKKVLEEKYLSVLSVFHDCTINGTYVTA